MSLSPSLNHKVRHLGFSYVRLRHSKCFILFFQILVYQLAELGSRIKSVQHLMKYCLQNLCVFLNLDLQVVCSPAAPLWVQASPGSTEEYHEIILLRKFNPGSSSASKVANFINIL
jgi:hypothetical protein